MNRQKINEYASVFLAVFAIILIFTALDFALHSLSEKFAVPQRYFPNKLIYGTIYGFFIFLILRKQSPFTKALLFSAVLDILLQSRYYIEGYPLDFVILFLALHFAILLPVSFVFFKSMKQIPKPRKRRGLK